jgi:hypothetical protein
MLVVMALVTTAMTGPLLDLAARFSVSPGPVPDTVSSVGRLRP